MSAADDLRDYILHRKPLDETPVSVTVELPRFLADRLAGEENGSSAVVSSQLRSRYQAQALDALLDGGELRVSDWAKTEADPSLSGEFVMVASTRVRERGAAPAFLRQAEAEGVTSEELLERYLMEGLRRDGALGEQA